MEFSGLINFFYGSGCRKAYYDSASAVPKHHSHCFHWAKPITKARADVRGGEEPVLPLSGGMAGMLGREGIDARCLGDELSPRSSLFLFSGMGWGPNGQEVSVVTGLGSSSIAGSRVSHEVISSWSLSHLFTLLFFFFFLMNWWNSFLGVISS